MKCWGDNSHGQLGNGGTETSNVPVDVSGLVATATEIAVGGYHACVLTDGAAVKCWGGNQYGQLGIGSTTDSPTPVGIPGLTSGVTTVSAGPNSTCASLDAGGVKCWGDNSYGQLGDGTTTSKQRAGRRPLLRPLTIRPRSARPNSREHGGDLTGFTLVRGDPEKLGRLRMSPEFLRP